MPSLSISSPIGDLTIDATGEAIVGIRWAKDPNGEPTPLLRAAARELQAYFAGQLTHFGLPLHAGGSPFEERVWTAMCAIPYGKTATYGDLAHDTGSAPRAVGRACGRNPIPIIVPCHRVLGRGNLGGYSGGRGLDTKRWLLQREGALPEEMPLLRAS